MRPLPSASNPWAAATWRISSRLASSCKRETHAEALANLEEIRKRGSENPEILFMLARAYFNHHRPDEAETVARLALEFDPTHAFSHLILARCALRKGDPNAAVEAALSSIRYNFGEPTAHFFLGVAYTQLGEWTHAEAALLNHLRLRPHHAAGLRYLVQVYRGMGDIAKAAAGQAMIAARLGKSSPASDLPSRDVLRVEIARRAMDRQAARDRRRSLETASDGQRSPVREFVIVSGLPRSGTSLMMQLLAAGGLEPMTDGEREADSDNPEGYYEWEPVKSLKSHPDLIERAAGKSVKVITSLLPSLPIRHRYKIIYMTETDRAGRRVAAPNAAAPWTKAVCGFGAVDSIPANASAIHPRSFEAESCLHGNGGVVSRACCRSRAHGRQAREFFRCRKTAAGRENAGGGASRAFSESKLTSSMS